VPCGIARDARRFVVPHGGSLPRLLSTLRCIPIGRSTFARLGRSHLFVVVAVDAGNVVSYLCRCAGARTGLRNFTSRWKVRAIMRVERSLPIWKTLGLGLARLPQIRHCAKTFKNWVKITKVYGGGSMPDRLVARGRKNFALPLRHPTDVQTAWVVYCTGD